MKMKICSHCQEALLPGQFHANRGNPDGLDYRCKECSAHARRALRHAEPERFRQFEANKNRNRARIQLAARHALKTGRLQAEPCFICGEQAEIHHPAYSAPLLVTWLCRSHHRQLHVEHAARQPATV